MKMEVTSYLLDIIDSKCAICRAPAKGIDAKLLITEELILVPKEFSLFSFTSVLDLSSAEIFVLIKEIISDLAIKEASKDFKVLSFIKFLFFELVKSAYDVARAI